MSVAHNRFANCTVATVSVIKGSHSVIRGIGGVNKINVKVKVIPRQAEVAQGVPGRLRPRIILMFRHYKGCRSSAIRTGRLYPRRNPWFSLSEAESTSGYVGGNTEKIPSDATGNRSRDRPTSSAVAWPLRYPRPHIIVFFLNNQQDALIIQIYSVIKLHMVRASSLPIIRSFLLYIWHW